MEQASIKIFYIIAIYGVGFLGGWLALRMEESAGSERLFSLGSALAAGVFLGAGLLHMLPDSIDAFHEVWPAQDYPWPALGAAAGAVLILLLERVLLASAQADSQALQKAVRQGGVFPLALLAALSIHSILAGVALGTEGTALGSVAIFIAIIAHKGSAAFSLVVGFHRGGFARGRILRVLAFFCLMTPLGVGLGLMFDALLEQAAGRGFEAVFDALAAGTFIYIASLDIIVEEFSKPRDRWPKFVMLCLGLALMALIAVWT
jgi:zinc transporter 1/2/3